MDGQRAKAKQNAGTRLDDALAYHQMQDPSPLNPATDDKLAVPLWVDDLDHCIPVGMSVECTCCPPSGV
jgi:hypothetical protein